MTAYRSPHGSGRGLRFVPGVEVLEERCLLAPFSFTVLPGGVVRLLGSNGTDRVVINDDGTGNVNNVVISRNGTVFLPGVAVTTVQVRTHAGNDQVTYNLNGPLQTGVARQVAVDLGTGSDQFNARFRAGLLTRSLLILQVNGHGFDQLNVNASSNIGIAANAILVANLVGGNDANAITFDYNGQLAGNLNLFEQGGAGPDHLSALLNLTLGSSGAVSAQELGGAGNDTFTMNAQKVSLFDTVTLAGIIDGGLGTDTCISDAALISTITTLHCERQIAL